MFSTIRMLDEACHWLLIINMGVKFDDRLMNKKWSKAGNFLTAQ